jgi:hypothetical protein
LRTEHYALHRQWRRLAPLFRGEAASFSAGDIFDASLV